MRFAVILFNIICILSLVGILSCSSPLPESMDYESLRHRLLSDTVSCAIENRINGILEFYRAEIPKQRSQRIRWKKAEEPAFYLDQWEYNQDTMDERLPRDMYPNIEAVPDCSIIDAAYLRNNIMYALQSVEKYPWNRDIPDSIFLHYLLPYKVVQDYPETWWDYLEPYYRDSLTLWGSGSFHGFDATDSRWIQRFTTAVPRELPKWWIYDGQAQTFTKYPSLKEILMLRKGGCYLEAMINVMILRTCGIPATIDEVPYWGSMNGSHAADVYWSSRAQKMITGYEREFYNPDKCRRPAKVVRYTFHYTGAYTSGIEPYLKGEEFQIPQMAGDHWYDATADHTSVSDVRIPVRKEIADRMELGYLYVKNYDDWLPVHYGRVIADSLHFMSMGRDVIYRAGFYSAGKDYFVTRPFLLDSLGNMVYSLPEQEDAFHPMTITMHAQKINHGEDSDVRAGESYTLRYLDRNGVWTDHSTKVCEVDGELIFEEVPKGAFYFLHTPSDQRHLARIFLIGKGGEQVWY